MRDTRVPEVSIHRQFKVLVEDDLDGLCSAGVRLVADPASDASVRAVTGTRTSQRILLAVGPEGGWTEFEIVLLKAHGFEGVTMGSRTLRSDTACIALLALVNDVW